MAPSPESTGAFLMPSPEVFGSDTQQAMMRKAHALWQLLKDDKRFQSHGRVVGLNAVECDDIGIHTALARLQGVAAINEIPAIAAPEYRQKLEAMGFKTDQFETWASGGEALKLSHAVMQNTALPSDILIVPVGAHTHANSLLALAKLTQSCDVLLPMGAFMRGLERPSVCLYAQDATGKPVGSAAAVAARHPSSQNTEQAWWGMLATDVERRGEGIALHLGALAMVAMHEQHGFNAFFTGIRKGNTASERLCAQLGWHPTGACVVVAMDPATFSGAQLTK
jgi:hypothetical protein